MLLEILLENENNQKQLKDFQNYDSHPHYSFEEEGENQHNKSHSESNSDSEKPDEEENPEVNAAEIENEDYEDQQCEINCTEPNENVHEEEEEEESGKEDEEVKFNKPERESKESLQAYLKNEIVENGQEIRECIFETGNMVKDSDRLFIEEINEKHFISLDSICEKTDKSNKISYKEEELSIFKEKLE